jgi:hypothetical protein
MKPATTLGRAVQGVIAARVQCGREGVQIAVQQILEDRRGVARPIMEALQSPVAGGHPLEWVF